MVQGDVLTLICAAVVVERDTFCRQHVPGVIVALVEPGEVGGDLAVDLQYTMGVRVGTVARRCPIAKTCLPIKAARSP